MSGLTMPYWLFFLNLAAYLGLGIVIGMRLKK